MACPQPGSMVFEPQQAMRSTCLQAVANSFVAVVGDAGLEGFQDAGLGVVAHRDDEGEAELRDIGVVQLGEASRAPRRSARRARRRPVRAVDSARQALGLRQLAGEVGVRRQHAQPLRPRWPSGRRGRAHCAGRRRCHGRGRVRGRRRARRSMANARRCRRTLRRMQSWSMRDGRSAGAW